MSVFKCKMCGGTIEFEQGATVGVCDSCGTKQTLPRLDDDKKANLYDRANHFRRNNDFDKAMGIYEQILNEDNTDAEAYWSLVLCRYGIEYVEDPLSHKRIPTVNRAQFTSVFADEDYKSALQYADGYQKTIYEDEAKAIDEIQKGILAISQKEEPFDIFICYKETDASGRRTQDSVLANDLYHQLTQEGFKVFFSRITLEDKLGTAYEPYIFAALNSSKVMVVLGTKPEYFNAVWVKNEWSRYLALIKSGAKKMLIPAYRDMDPYDLPEEFSHLQAQDMGKLGFVQDLIRGIKKIIEADKSKQSVKETVIVDANNAAVAPLLERVYLFLEDEKWEDANIYCEKVLDIDPKNAEAYLGKLMVELQVRNRKQLADCDVPFDNSDNYSKVLRFGDEALEAEMRGYIMTIIYNSARKAMDSANSEESFKEAADAFAVVSGFEDADALAQQCIDKAEVCRKDAIYSSAITKMSSEKVDSYEEAIEMFQKIPSWKNSEECIYACQRKIEEIKRKVEERRIKAEKAAKKRKKAFAIGTPIVAVCIAFAIALTTVIIPTIKYNNAVKKYGKEWADTVKNASIGDTIVFGAYEQDNNASNGKEDIEWMVLDKKDMMLLLISKKVLDFQQYNTSWTDVTWETCSLRKWMNGTFLNNAFSTDEQAKIATTNVSVDKNPEYSTNPGNATKDKVFLLSIKEAEKYFSSDSARQCSATAYAKEQRAYTTNSNDNCCWWLRSPGYNQSDAAYVDIDGSVGYGGDYVDSDYFDVRPALWIDLDS